MTAHPDVSVLFTLACAGVPLGTIHSELNPDQMQATEGQGIAGLLLDRLNLDPTGQLESSSSEDAADFSVIVRGTVAV